MLRMFTLMAAVALIVAGSAHADYTVESRGTWPESWPKELEPLRDRSRTLEGPLAPHLHYAIPFTKREEFEAAWPHLLKVKSPGAPIVLRRGPSFWLDAPTNAGVCVHMPPAGAENRDPNQDAERIGKQVKRDLVLTTYIELIVDGDVVDLNRIQLPPDTPIIDERFKEKKAK